MAMHIVAPGVERTVSECDGTSFYYGTLDALKSAHLVARDCVAPGGVPGKRGVRWRCSDGRRHVLSKYRGDELRLTVYPLPEDLAATKRAKLAAKFDADSGARSAVIDRELSSWSDSQGQFDYVLGRCVDDVLKEVGRYAWKDSPCRGPWTLANSERDKFEQIRVVMRIMLQDLKVEHDPTWRVKLEQERAMLLGESPVDSRFVAAAADVIARVRG